MLSISASLIALHHAFMWSRYRSRPFCLQVAEYSLTPSSGASLQNKLQAYTYLPRPFPDCQRDHIPPQPLHPIQHRTPRQTLYHRSHVLLEAADIILHMLKTIVAIRIIAIDRSGRMAVHVGRGQGVEEVRVQRRLDLQRYLGAQVREELGKGRESL